MSRMSLRNFSSRSYRGDGDVTAEELARGERSPFIFSDKPDSAIRDGPPRKGRINIWAITTVVLAALLALQSWSDLNGTRRPGTYETGFSTDMGKSSCCPCIRHFPAVRYHCLVI
jgi:hypothetical protein